MRRLRCFFRQLWAAWVKHIQPVAARLWGEEVAA